MQDFVREVRLADAERRGNLLPQVKTIVDSLMLPLDGELILSGSVQRGTALRSLHDVDFLVPLKDSFRMHNGEKSKPQYIISDRKSVV